MVDRWIKRGEKRWPAGTILAANESLPMKDRSSRLVADRLPSQDLVREVMSCSLVRGSLRCCREESTSMPRTVRQVAGPLDFSMATGMPVAGRLAAWWTWNPGRWANLVVLQDPVQGGGKVVKDAGGERKPKGRQVST